MGEQWWGLGPMSTTSELGHWIFLPKGKTSWLKISYRRSLCPRSSALLLTRTYSTNMRLDQTNHESNHDKSSNTPKNTWWKTYLQTGTAMSATQSSSLRVDSMLSCNRWLMCGLTGSVCQAKSRPILGLLLKREFFSRLLDQPSDRILQTTVYVITTITNSNFMRSSNHQQQKCTDTLERQTATFFAEWTLGYVPDGTNRGLGDNTAF